jgi:hypothetical protein
MGLSVTYLVILRILADFLTIGHIEPLQSFNLGWREPSVLRLMLGHEPDERRQEPSLCLLGQALL